MQVTLNGTHIMCWSIDGILENGITVDEPEDFEDFFINYAAYIVEDGKLKIDMAEKERLEHETFIGKLRELREVECFPIINRGRLWYDTLTTEQINELQIWYKQWLDVTLTETIPDRPEWLDKT